MFEWMSYFICWLSFTGHFNRPFWSYILDARIIFVFISLIHSYFGKHDKTSAPSWKFRFWKNLAKQKDVHRISLQFRLDESTILNTRLSRVFNHLQNSSTMQQCISKQVYWSYVFTSFSTLYCMSNTGIALIYVFSLFYIWSNLDEISWTELNLIKTGNVMVSPVLEL